MKLQLDKIDKRIIYRLSKDSRNSTTTKIGEEMGVSPGTIRNRLEKLEKKGVIKGYHANINYEKTNQKLITLVQGSIPLKESEKIFEKILKIPEVINVRRIMTGSIDLHIMIIGDNAQDSANIAKKINKVGVKIEDEDLVQNESFSPYQPFGPKKKNNESIIDLKKLSGNVETVNLTVDPKSSVINKSLKEINENNLIRDEILIIAIERENKVITPKGDTIIKPNDILTILSPNGIMNKDLKPFEGNE